MTNRAVPEEKAKANGQETISYSPSAIVNIFNNALNNSTTRMVVQVRGIYTRGRGTNYNGYYYDQLKEESSDACITLIVPGIMRGLLIQNQIIDCHAFITKKVQANGARIELQLNMMELISQRASLYTDEQLHVLKVVQKKAQTGYKDVDSFLKTKIIRQEPISVIIIIGNSAIIDSDIKHQLEEAIGFYNIDFHRINLTSEEAIIHAIEINQADADILIIARGGGENLGIFNRPSLAEAVLDLNVHFLTAIGHETDKTLLQQVADKGFITPTALGQYLNTLYNETIAELQNSKAKLVEDITKQLQVNYEHQINNSKQEAAAAARQHQARMNELQALYEEKIKLARGSGTNTTLYWILICAAVIIGVLLGRLLHS